MQLSRPVPRLRHALPPVVAALLLTACAQAPEQSIRTAPPLQQLSPPPTAYAVQPNDQLAVHFLHRPEWDRELTVRPDGMITLPFVGNLQAKGQTAEGIALQIEERYRALGESESFEASGPPRVGFRNAAAVPRDEMQQRFLRVGSTSTPRNPSEYLISVHDELSVDFPFQPELSQKVQVRPDGMISLPLAQTLQAEGLTPRELEAELKYQYASHLKDPQLTVMVASYHGRRVLSGDRVELAGFRDMEAMVQVTQHAPQLVFVGGQVDRPGAVEYRHSLTALQAILEAGGGRDTADMRRVVILRKQHGDALRIERNLAADAAAAVTNDFFLHPSDVLIVPRTRAAAIAHWLDQHIFQIFPFFRNSSTSVVYNTKDGLGAR